MRALINVTSVTAALGVIGRNHVIGRHVPGHSEETTTLVVDNIDATAVMADGSLKIWFDDDDTIKHDGSATVLDASVGPVPVVATRTADTKFEHEVLSASGEIQPLLGGSGGGDI